MVKTRVDSTLVVIRAIQADKFPRKGTANNHRNNESKINFLSFPHEKPQLKCNHYLRDEDIEDYES
jgi:hypothetical protein